MACFVLRSCTPGNTTVLYTTDVLTPTIGTYVGNSISITQGTGCYTVQQIFPPCSICTPGNTIAITGIQTNTCFCETKCYTLTDCCNSSITHDTFTNLNPYIGTTISVAEYPGSCFTVSVKSTPCSSPNPVTCVQSCVCPTCPTCYKLQNCQVLGAICTVSYTGTLTIGNVISLLPGEIPIGYSTYPNCWTIIEQTPCSPTASTITSFIPQTDCATCIGKSYILTPCEIDGTVLCTNTNLGSYLTSTITISGIVGCFTVTETTTPCVSNTPINIDDISTCTCPSCYLVENCQFPLSTAQVSSAAYPGLNTVISITAGIVIPAGVPNCWKVKNEINCTTLVPTITYVTQTDCATCTSITSDCYKLTSCDGQTIIYTQTDLSLFTYVTNVPGYSGVCFSVSLAPIEQCNNPIIISDPQTCTCQCYVLIDCVTNQPYIKLFNPTANGIDLSLIVGQVISKICVSPNTECVTGCWKIQEAGNCDSAVSRYVYDIKATCTACLEQCYDIKDCESQQVIATITYTTPNNLLPDPSPSTLVGQSIGNLCFTPTAGGCIPGCYYLDLSTQQNCVNAIDWTDVVSYTKFNNCLACKATCYLLEPCDPVLSTILVNNDLSGYINQVINVCLKDAQGIESCACYTVKPSQTCDGAISIPNPTSTVESCNDCTYCYCPPGYEKVGDVCQKIVSVPATPSGTLYNVGPGAVSPGYGSLGTNFYPNITSLPYPISEAASQFQDASATVLAPVVNINTPATVWTGPTGSRLNTVGVWTTAGGGAPTNEWIGFTHCVDIPTSKTYCIGIAADNKIRFKIDGTLVMQATNFIAFNFNYWHVFEINLTQGFHVIQVEGLNVAGAASFGAEIYDATSAILQAMTTVAQVQGVTIFSTFDKIGAGTNIFDVGENSGYTCPPGSVFNNCGDGPSCTTIESVPYVDCPKTYKVIDCTGVQPDFITNTDLSAYVNGNFYKVCIGDAAPVASPPSIVTPNNPDQPYSYTLTDCKGLVQPFCTVDNLYAYINTYVTIFGFPGSCFLVTADPPGTRCDNPRVVDVDPNTQCSCDTPPDPAWPDGCYCVTVEAADSAIGQPFTGVFGDAFASCDACTKICYILIDCDNIEDPIKVTGTDLADCVGGVVKIKGCEDKCWIVTESDNCDGCITEATVIQCFPAPKDTNICTYGPIATYEYSDTIKITINSTLYTSPLIGYCNPQNWIDWFNSLNLGVFTVTADGTTPCPVITIVATGTETYGNLCYTNNAGLPECAPKTCESIPPVDQPLPCDLCNPPIVPVEPELKLNLRPVVPGYKPPVCSPEYYDKVNCMYADQVNTQMLAVRYGLEVCCDDEFDKWDIKKELLDLQSIKNPNLP